MLKHIQPGMKRDMGGAAAILAAFQAAVKVRVAAAAENGTSLRRGCRALHAVLCLAENSVDATSTRPDDIHTLYSGRTVSLWAPILCLMVHCRKIVQSIMVLEDWAVGNNAFGVLIPRYFCILLPIAAMVDECPV